MSKEIKLQNETFYIVDPKGINYNRYIKFQNYMQILLSEDLSELGFTILKNKIMKAVNEGNIYEIAVILTNIELNTKLKTDDADLWGLCFALICNEKNEDVNNFDDAFIKSKLLKFSSLGLTHDLVKSEVVNFTRAFPITSAILAMKMEGLKKLSF